MAALDVRDDLMCRVQDDGLVVIALDALDPPRRLPDPNDPVVVHRGLLRGRELAVTPSSFLL